MHYNGFRILRGSYVSLVIFYDLYIYLLWNDGSHLQLLYMTLHCNDRQHSMSVFLWIAATLFKIPDTSWI